jgi:DNA-directed RNA polymerase specialized sigma24 family protein
MDAVRAEITVRSNQVRKHQKNGPLTEEQRALIEKWYAYAMAVAFDHARRPYDDHEIRTVAHDALISAARYYQEGRGCNTFKSFYKHCLLPQLARAFQKRIAKMMVQIPDEMEVSYTPEAPSFETHEFVSYLRQELPANQREVVHQVYEMGMSHRQIASLRGCEHQNVTHLHRLALRGMRKRADWSYIASYASTICSSLAGSCFDG